eukprot:5370842-Pyramimonas_sp.AAC.1
MQEGRVRPTGLEAVTKLLGVRENGTGDSGAQAEHLTKVVGCVLSSLTTKQADWLEIRYAAKVVL